jgi:hypothetical protein
LIFFFRASIRSLWSPVVVLLGLCFSLAGVAVLADPRIGSRIDVASVVIGFGVTGLGLAIAWGGCRMGVVGTPAGLVVRELFGGETYEPEVLAGFAVGEQFHDVLPLMIIFPVLVLAQDGEVAVMSLANYSIFPGARQRAAKAAETMAEWTGRPVVG